MDLTAEVTSVKGIGEKTAQSLEKAGIFSVRDLLYTLPRDYENFQSLVSIQDLTPGKVMIRGRISGLETNYARRRHLSITSGKISDSTGSVRVVWFNQPYRAKQFDENREYYFTGEYNLKNGRYQLTSPSAILAEDIGGGVTPLGGPPASASARERGKMRRQDPERQSSGQPAIYPIYRQKAGIKPPQFNKFFKSLRPIFADIPDLLPGTMKSDPLKTTCPSFIYQGARKDALFSSHFPDTELEVKNARRYLAYEELFELLLAAKLSKEENSKLKAKPLKFDQRSTKKIVESLPFKLTNAQRRATWDILQDLEKPTPMNRLLQGDVGSGKTVVAAISAFQAAQNGCQTALLAPTAILATQHYEGLLELLGPLGIKVALLTGATKDKDTIKNDLKAGKIDLLIGTHAIITDDTYFHSLAFCIIDEQHRFGVDQRQKLLLKTARNTEKSSKNIAPHLLSMTATPIPRSLQLTIFGDLDISIIDELPKGRQQIETEILRNIDQREKLYPKVTAEIKNGHQIYWICKNIEDSPKLETTSVKKQAEKLKTIYKNYKIEFLHGRMKPAEKDEIMERFSRGKIDILVSTTVVEVGVNVPNATVMVIMDAENYGLAQLHQLRGRVGRGQAKSYCFLLTGNENEPTRRLKEMEKSADGFYLAEADLKIRGPGEIYGALQHGALDLRIATLSDTKLIAAASKQAKTIASAFSKNPDSMLKYKELMSGISHYQQLTTLN